MNENIPNENINTTINSNINSQCNVGQMTPPPPMQAQYYQPNYYMGPPAETEQQKAERASLFARLIGPTLIYAILFTFCIYKNFAGITVPILALATVVYSFYCLKVYNLEVKRGSYLYGAVIILLGVSSCTTGSIPIITFNTIGMVLMLLCMLLHNFYNDNLWNLAKYIGAIFMSIFGAISVIASPFSDLSNYEKHKTNKSKGLYVVIGIAIAFPLLIIIISLLYYADAVFADVINTIFENISIGNIIGIAFTFVFAFLSAYCGIRYLGKHEISEEVKDYRRFNAIIAVTVLSLIAIVYMLFSGIQILYLFIGNMELPDGYTYASYAHEGFFQLLFVCILNVIIVLSTISFFKNNIFVKILLTIISFCTYIMLASSALRMWLYVQNYSLSVLRVFVFWALLVLALLLVGIFVQILREEFHLFRYGLVVVCACYLTLSFGHMDYWIAKFNLEYVASNDGSVDYEYLTSLSSDAAPVIAEQSGDWADLYAYNQMKYTDDGIRKFNFSHNNAINTFSKYISKHKDYYCVTLTPSTSGDKILDPSKISSVTCTYNDIDFTRENQTANADCVINPSTGKPVFVTYIPKEEFEEKDLELSISYTICYKSDKKIYTDNYSFYPSDANVNYVEVEGYDNRAYLYAKY